MIDQIIKVVCLYVNLKEPLIQKISMVLKRTNSYYSNLKMTKQLLIERQFQSYPRQSLQIREIMMLLNMFNCAVMKMRFLFLLNKVE